jgi:hypothetical protein
MELVVGEGDFNWLHNTYVFDKCTRVTTSEQIWTPGCLFCRRKRSSGSDDHDISQNSPRELYPAHTLDPKSSTTNVYC